MWYPLTDGNGGSVSYGFAPDKAYEGQHAAPGDKVVNPVIETSQELGTVKDVLISAR